MGQTTTDGAASGNSVREDTVPTVAQTIAAAARRKRRLISPLRAHRLHCRRCCPSSYLDIRACRITDCPSWRFRFGIRPATAARRGLPVDPAAMPPERRVLR